MPVKRGGSGTTGSAPSWPGARRRARNPQGQGGRLRADLIEAADRILSRTGDLDGLSLRAVAREVGVATPSIYLHFPDKRSLVLAVLTVRFEQLADAVRTAVAQATGSAEQLRAGCLAYCRFATEHPNAYRVLFGRSPALPPASSRRRRQAGSAGDGGRATLGSAGARALETDTAPPVQDAGGSFAEHPGATPFGFLVQGVAACMRDGVAPAGDPHRVATSIWTALHGIVSLRGAAPGFPWPPLTQQVDDALAGLAGLRHSPSSAEG
jgi:AcrR family transcriptional regulator